jgi:hypothetical protein
MWLSEKQHGLVSQTILVVPSARISCYVHGGCLYQRAVVSLELGLLSYPSPDWTGRWELDLDLRLITRNIGLREEIPGFYLVIKEARESHITRPREAR